MATLSQNGISFNDIKTNGLPVGTSNIHIPGFNGVDPDDGGLINAVDVDWNNAQLQSAVQSLESNLQEGVAVSEITTSGDLLKVIAQLQAQVNTLTVLIKGLYNGLSA